MTDTQNQEITLYLTQTLTEYEVISANFGWHIHKGDIYCGQLQYQGANEWQGSALSHLPNELKQQLKKFALSISATPYAMNYGILPASGLTNVA